MRRCTKFVLRHLHLWMHLHETKNRGAVTSPLNITQLSSWGDHLCCFYIHGIPKIQSMTHLTAFWQRADLGSAVWKQVLNIWRNQKGMVNMPTFNLSEFLLTFRTGIGTRLHWWRDIFGVNQSNQGNACKIVQVLFGRCVVHLVDPKKYMQPKIYINLEGRYGLVDKTHPSCVRPGLNTRVQH